MIGYLAATCLMITGANAPAASWRQDAGPPKSVLLKRVYQVGEEQKYNALLTIESQGSEFKIETSVTQKVVKATASGEAEIEFTTNSLKFTFGGEAQDAPVLPKPERLPFDVFGMPSNLELSDDSNPMVSALVVAYLPNKEVPLGGEFKIDWKSSDGYAVEGEGKLIATGRLYEEHVAKIEVEITTTDTEGGTGKITAVIYTNSKTGKLVKAEGDAEFESDGETSRGKMKIDKVRSK